MKTIPLLSCVVAFAITADAVAQHTHPPAGPTPAPSPSAQAEARAALGAEAVKTLGVTMSRAGAALAKDDFAAYQALQPAIRDAYHDLADIEPALAESISSSFADPLPVRPEIAAARRDFARFSTAVADAVRTRKLLRPARLRLFECRMAPEIGVGRWLQTDSVARNPFFGSAMLQCGTELDRPESARALPPGHPPIGHLSPAEKARFAGATKAADAGCGGCGMSKEAMAAGEPCEHGKKK